MRKSISLKEFSTTPTVSCMLRKDGNNVASDQQVTQPNTSAVRANTQMQQQQTQQQRPAQTQDNDGMFEME